jgi:hypothetical protein
MKIISKNNKKDFYDYLAFGYDISEDIVYVRNTQYEKIKEKSDLFKYFDKFIPYNFQINTGLLLIDYMIIGIYPKCYLVPFIVKTDNYFNDTFLVFPFKYLDDKDKLYNFANEHNIEISNRKYLPNFLKHNSYFYRDKNIIESFEDIDLFKKLGVPTFIFTKNISFVRRCSNDLQDLNLIKNPIFNELHTNVLKYIQEDLNKRPIYNDIENFLWSIKQEPISEPDNKTKIINHGFDLKTSFRKM